MTKPKWTDVKIRLGDIICWEHNPRMSNKAQANRLIESEKQWGQPMTFAVSPFENGKVQLYDGHQRYGAWLTVYGEDYEVDARQCDRALTEDERIEFVVTMHAGATGQWDWQKLSSFPAPKLIEWGFDNELKKQLDNDANNVKELLNAEIETVDAEPQIDRAAELQDKWQTAIGQLWKLGNHRLLIGDCTVRENVERLMGGERASLAPVDPPYNVGFEYDGETVDDTKTEEKYKEFCIAWFGECQRISEKQIVTPGCYNLASWMRWFDAYHWTPWVKTNAMTNGKVSRFLCWEPMLFFGKTWKRSRSNDIFDFPVQPQKMSNNGETLSGLHPCPKPLGMWEDLIENYSELNDIIYECFGGSGTTLMACVNKSRLCRIMEISPAYGAVIIERFYTATGITPELVE